MTQTLKAAGGLAAATLGLALLTSCASGPPATPTAPLATPTAPIGVPTPSLIPSPASQRRRGEPTGPAIVPTPTPVPVPASPGLGARRVLPPPGPSSPAAKQPPAPARPGAGRVLITAADGYVADGEGLSPFATDNRAVGNLAPDLLAAVQRASTDAAREGVALTITSGWRSVRYQQSLLDAAIEQYGSEAEARRWVSTPAKSTHVTGQAVDLGPPTTANLWLRQRGNRYGLCQVYANEPWHYELATDPGGNCPRPRADASEG